MTTYPVTGFTPSQSMSDARAWRIAMEQYFGKRQSLGSVIQTEAKADMVREMVDFALSDSYHITYAPAFARYPYAFNSCRYTEDERRAEWLGEPATIEQAVSVAHCDDDLGRHVIISGGEVLEL